MTLTEALHLCLSQLGLSDLLLVSALWAAWLCLRYRCNPLFRLPGPASAGLPGYGREFWMHDSTQLHERWVELYGRTISYRVFWHTCFFTMDTKALTHILSRDDVYQKPYRVRTAIADFMGMGTPMSEGEAHRRQKKIVSPAVGPLQLREFHQLFLDKAAHLRDVLWSTLPGKDSAAQVDMYTWMHRSTLDIICEAAFGCSIGAVDAKDDESNELCDAFRLVSASVTRLTLWPMLRFFFPILRIFPEQQAQRLQHARKVMGEFATKLIEQKRFEMREIRELADEKAFERPRWSRSGNFLTLIVEANASTSEAQRISDQTMIDECCTFLVAGHETTCTVLAWLFYELGTNPEVQKRLRRELYTLDTDRPSIAQLNALEYLDCVVREAIRLHPSIPSSMRVAEKSDSVPLADPIWSKGQMVDNVFVPKGTPIFIPILAMNRDRALWGEDAHDFRPERWDTLPDAVKDIPSIWGQSLTFLAGHHACLGFRFALYEIKAIVFTLLRSFEFDLAVPPEDIGRSATVLARPTRLSDPDYGPQLPMLMRPCSRP